MYIYLCWHSPTPPHPTPSVTCINAWNSLHGPWTSWHLIEYRGTFWCSGCCLSFSWWVKSETSTILVKFYKAVKLLSILVTQGMKTVLLLLSPKTLSADMNWCNVLLSLSSWKNIPLMVSSFKVELSARGHVSFCCCCCCFLLCCNILHTVYTMPYIFWRVSTWTLHNRSFAAKGHVTYPPDTLWIPEMKRAGKNK